MRHSKSRATRQEEYRQYLLTPHWINLREQALLRDHYTCCRCPARFNLEVHHKCYRKDWHDTELFELETLCFDCHKKEHAPSLAPNAYHPVPKRRGRFRGRQQKSARRKFFEKKRRLGWSF